MTSKYNWKTIKKYTDIRFDFFEGVAKITINRPQVRNAFRPLTIQEMIEAVDFCKEKTDIYVVIITGEGDKAFCSGGDQNVKGIGGYIGEDGVPRLNVLELQKKIRSLPKPVIAMVNGFAIGGGHVLHVVCDLTIASENAIFGQTGPKVGSFDAGFGVSFSRKACRTKKSKRNMVSLQTIFCKRSFRNGIDKHYNYLRKFRTNHHRMVPNDNATQPTCH